MVNKLILEVQSFALATRYIKKLKKICHTLINRPVNTLDVNVAILNIYFLPLFKVVLVFK